jgi:peptidoglycan/LPS O-acetylase OafA/YrhL
MTLDAHATGRENNFNLLRLLAATIVLVSHSFLITGAVEPTVGHWTLGTVGVQIFFVISGFLIAMSWFRRPGLRGFAVRRGLRIIPALVVAVVACAFVLGPLVTELTPSKYLTDPATPEYVVDNVVAVGTGGAAHHVDLDLPGVFKSNPDTAVNRPLWTLPIEVEAYALVALLGIAGLLAGSVALVAAAFFLLSIAPGGVESLPVVGAPIEFLRGADGLAAHLVALFFISALFYKHRKRVPLRLDLALVALLVLVASLGTAAERPVLLIAIPYLVLTAAYRSWGGLRVLTRPGDVSYGIYLLAFPVQQTIFHLWGGNGPTALTVSLIAFPVTYLLALASWHGVEKRALRMKDRLTAPRRGSISARAERPEAVDAAPAAIQP